MDLLAGFSGGFVIFSVLGHVSHETGIDITSFNQSGISADIFMSCEFLYPQEMTYNFVHFFHTLGFYKL
jgi:hypothetical protein